MLDCATDLSRLFMTLKFTHITFYFTSQMIKENALLIFTTEKCFPFVSFFCFTINKTRSIEGVY